MREIPYDVALNDYAISRSGAIRHVASSTDLAIPFLNLKRPQPRIPWKALLEDVGTPCRDWVLRSTTRAWWCCSLAAQIVWSAFQTTMIERVRMRSIQCTTCSNIAPSCCIMHCMITNCCRNTTKANLATKSSTIWMWHRRVSFWLRSSSDTDASSTLWSCRDLFTGQGVERRIEVQRPQPPVLMCLIVILSSAPCSLLLLFLNVDIVLTLAAFIG